MMNGIVDDIGLFVQKMKGQVREIEKNKFGLLEFAIFGAAAALGVGLACFGGLLTVTTGVAFAISAHNLSLVGTAASGFGVLCGLFTTGIGYETAKYSGKKLYDMKKTNDKIQAKIYEI